MFQQFQGYLRTADTAAYLDQAQSGVASRVPSRPNLTDAQRGELAICFLAAAHRLEVFGWVQRDYVTREGICAAQAIMDAVHIFMIRPEERSGPPPFITHRMALGALDLFANFVGASSPIAWNDWPGRTKEQVLKEFRALAKELQQPHEPPKELAAGTND